jgi:tetratricopeptide (TPR) repeat protein
MKKSLANWIALASCLLLFGIGIPAQSAVDSAKKLFDAGQYKDAELILRAEVAKNPSDPAIQYWLAKCAFELYDDDLAFSSAERAVNLDPKNAEYHYFLGTTAGYKAEHSNWFSGLSLARKTQHEFLTAVQLNPDKLEAQRDLISYYIAAPGIAGGGDDKAQAQITQLDIVHVVSARLARMELYENRKKWTEADNEAKSVLAARPKQLKTFLEVAEYYQNREDATGIRNALAGVPRDTTADPHVTYYRAVADVIAGENLQEAQKSIDAYLSMQPRPLRQDHVTLGNAHSWMGRLYLKLGWRTSAVTECREALKLEPKNRYAHDCLKRIDSQ